jgi:mannosyltransferase
MSNSSFNLIVSDIHHRISGVSATVRAIMPKMATLENCVIISKFDIDNCERLSLRQLLCATRHHNALIWHVRRNNEMTWALIFKYIFKRNIHIVFTSAAIRRHSWWPRQLISMMDTVIATSQKAALLIPNVKAVIAHGVDVERFNGKLSAKPLPSLEGDHVFVGIIGRVRPEKGTDVFIQSMLNLMKTDQTVKAVIVGKTTAKFSTFEKQLKQEISNHNLTSRFIWLDEIVYETMPDIYAQLDLVVCPAKYEGFGLVPLEAMACGCAVVATHTGAYKELILEDKTGFVVELNDQTQLQEKISELLENKEKLQQFQINARPHVVNNFSLDNEISAIRAVYADIRG